MFYFSAKSKLKRDLRLKLEDTLEEATCYIHSKFSGSELCEKIKDLRATIKKLESEKKQALKKEKKHNKRWPCRKWYENEIMQFEYVSEKIDALLCDAKKVLQHWEGLDQELNEKEKEAKSRASHRLKKSEELSKERVNQYFSNSKGNRKDIDLNDVLSQSFFVSIFSVALGESVGHLNVAGVYDALREVNGSFSGLSDIEIWFETLAMSGSGLQGLVSLTKGRYFENLVAEDTGGVLFENFNHPDTDMMLDGVAYQLKATDSMGYINSIDDEISVIATSEVAGMNNVIDSHISNAEITEDVTTALGGITLDISDIVAIFTGAVTIFSVLSINADYHTRREQGDSGEVALFSSIESYFIRLYRSLLKLGGYFATCLDILWILTPVKLLKRLALALDGEK